jgi:hypothetical protein
MLQLRRIQGMSGKTKAIMEIAHSISQLRSIVYMVEQSRPNGYDWIKPEIDHAEEHLANAVEALDAAPEEKTA